MRRSRVFTVAISLSLILAVGLPAGAAEEITIEGGGWGHGIGMSQHGAKALADKGQSAAQILAHFYSGASLGTVGSGNLVGHAEPLLIGAAQHQKSLAFQAVNGPLTLCTAVGCVLTASADGSSWSYRTIGLGECQYFKDGVAQGQADVCSGWITWESQPNTRISFPGLDRVYARGRISFLPAPGDTFHMRVEVKLEQYLYGLGEMPSSWHVEALRAQAIAGRTYALWRAWVYRDLGANKARLDACGCHLYASTFDQKYIGWAKEVEGTDGHWGKRWVSAVDSTAGRALIHTASDGRALQAYYFSSSGGKTENNEDVWGGTALPYLRSASDPGASFWTKVLTTSAFAAALGWDTVNGASIDGWFTSGSPSSITVRGYDGGVRISKKFTGNQLRSALGLRSHYIKSFAGFLPSFSVFRDGDFDGDGADELAAFSTDDGTWWVFDYEGGELVGYKWADFRTTKGWGTQVVGDFDGDGRDDIANFYPGNGTWWVARSTGSSFSTTLWADFSTASGWKTQIVGDFNGDGRDDIANFYPGNGTWWVARSTGSSFSTTLWADFSTASGWSAQIAGDFNGDGNDDIANFHPSNGTWWVSRSSGSSFSTGLWADFTTANGWGPQIVGDFNGDGNHDIANFHDSNGTWWVSKSSGSSFSTGLWADFTTTKGWAPQIVGDVNGDGKDDIANFYPGNGSWWVSRSSGGAFSTYRQGVLSGSGWKGHLTADIDGDGNDELVAWAPAPMVWAVR